MIFLKDFKATVWKPEIKDKFVKANLSTSEKKQNGDWENSNWNAMFVGRSLEFAKDLKDKDRIKIISAKITNVYNAEKKVSYLNLVIFEADFVDAPVTTGFTDVDDDDDLPF